MTSYRGKLIYQTERSDDHDKHLTCEHINGIHKSKLNTSYQHHNKLGQLLYHKDVQARR